MFGGIQEFWKRGEGPEFLYFLGGEGRQKQASVLQETVFFSVFFLKNASLLVLVCANV